MKKEAVKNQGIVLKKTDYKETGSIITLITNEGIETLIVKGTKKTSSKLRSLTNIFSLIDYVRTSNDGLNTLIEGTVVESYCNFYDDIEKMSYAQVIIEKILILSNSITDYQILYSFLIDIFNLLSFTNYPEIVTLVFEVKLLYLLGIAPNLKTCIKCQKAADGVFVLNEGGIICRNCLRNYKYSFILNNEETDVFKLLYLIKINMINQNFYDIIKSVYQRLNLAVDYYYNYFLDFTSSAKKVIKQLTIRQ